MLALLGQHMECVERRPEEAKAAYARALALAAEHGHVTAQVEMLSALVRTAAEPPSAQAAAARAVALARGVPSPVAAAAAAEAQALVAAAPDDLGGLQGAAELWKAAGRLLDAARCRLLVAHRLHERGDSAAASALQTAEAEYERLGAGHHLAKSGA